MLTGRLRTSNLNVSETDCPNRYRYHIPGGELSTENYPYKIHLTPVLPSVKRHEEYYLKLEKERADAA